MPEPRNIIRMDLNSKRRPINNDNIKHGINIIKPVAILARPRQNLFKRAMTSGCVIVSRYIDT